MRKGVAFFPHSMYFLLIPGQVENGDEDWEMKDDCFIFLKLWYNSD